MASYATNALNQYTQITTPQTEFVRGTAQGAASVTVNGQAIALGADGSFNARITGSGPATIVVTAADGSTSTETRTVALLPSTFAPSYDLDGNMLSDGLWTYTWDGENRLVALESTAANPLPQRVLKRFRYDFQSRRIAEERYLSDPAQGSGGAYVLEKAQRWFYDGWNQTLELLNDRPVRVYVWGLDLSGTRERAGGVGGLLSSVDLVGSEMWDYLYDGNGNVVGLADGSSGSVDGEYVYGPFGEELAASGKAARLNRFSFSTKMHDPDLDAFNFGYRLYSPRLARWLSRDPIQEKGGLNLYGMVVNDTLNRLDYLGRATVFCNGRCGAKIDDWIVKELTSVIYGWHAFSGRWPKTVWTGGPGFGVPTSSPKPGYGDFLGWIYANADYKNPKKFEFSKNTQCGKGDCGVSVTLCDKCVKSSVLGNIMYGLIGEFARFSDSELESIQEQKRFAGRGRRGPIYDPFDSMAYDIGQGISLSILDRDVDLTLEDVCSSLNAMPGFSGGYGLMVVEDRALTTSRSTEQCELCEEQTRETRHSGHFPPGINRFIIN